jgi:hypothetical protein
MAIFDAWAAYLAATPKGLEKHEGIRRVGAFRTRRIDSLDRRRSTALIRARHELAVRKRRVRMDGGDPEADRLVARWRHEIARLREWA